MTLTDFLLARIAEDEAGQAGGHDYWCSWMQASEPCDCPRKRIMSESASRRRIVTTASGWMSADVETRSAMSTIKRLLALPYADHPDYREEWKP